MMDLENFYELLMEEWKPFPKDKVNRSIEKKEKSNSRTNQYRAHVQKAVKNYKTKMTDPHKNQQKYTGSDYDKNVDKSRKHSADRMKHYDKADKYYDKKAKKTDDGRLKPKHQKKYDDKMEKGHKAAERRDAMDQVRMAYRRTSASEDQRQAAANRKSKEDRQKAKKMLNRAGLEAAHKKPAVKGATKGGFKKESLNFTEFCNAFVSPLYEADGIPQCPPGYKFDKKNMMCVPKTSKDDVRGNRNDKKDLEPGNMPSFNSIGSHGQNGAPYAYEEGGNE